jgi:hypothetical protein
MIAKKFALAFGVAVVFPAMIHFGVSTFTPKPKWPDYLRFTLNTQDYTSEQRQRREEEFSKRQSEYRAAEKRFETHLFVIAVPLGLLAVITGAFLGKLATGTGFMFGGIFTVGDGYFAYWSHLSDTLKFVSLLATFIILIAVGYAKLERKSSAAVQG